MNIIKKNIERRIAELTESLGFLLIDVVIRGDSRNQVVEIFIDNEEGVSAEDCAELSKLVNLYFEDTLQIDSKYRLDVSSPGVDRPLKYLVQFKKHLNRNFEIKFIENDKKQKLTGELKSIDGDNLFFQKGKDLVKLNFSNITSAKVLISF